MRIITSPGKHKENAMYIVFTGNRKKLHNLRMPLSSCCKKMRNIAYTTDQIKMRRMEIAFSYEVWRFVFFVIYIKQRTSGLYINRMYRNSYVILSNHKKNRIQATYIASSKIKKASYYCEEAKKAKCRVPKQRSARGSSSITSSPC